MTLGLNKKDGLGINVEKEMATHSRMEEPGGLLSIGLHRVGHD